MKNIFFYLFFRLKVGLLFLCFIYGCSNITQKTEPVKTEDTKLSTSIEAIKKRIELKKTQANDKKLPLPKDENLPAPKIEKLPQPIIYDI